MKLKHILVATMATFAFASGNANALTVSSGGDLFLVAINETTGGSFIAPISTALSATAATFDNTKTGSINFSSATGYSTAWGTFTTGSIGGDLTYGVYGVDTTSGKLLSTINPTNFTSAGTADNLLGFIQSAKTGAVFTWATSDNLSVTGTTAAYRADAVDGNGYTFTQFVADALTGTAGNQIYTGSNASLYALSTSSFGLNPMTASLFSNTFNLADNGVFTVAAVPEADTSAMMIAGLGLMGFVARRRSSKK